MVRFPERLRPRSIDSWCRAREAISIRDDLKNIVNAVFSRPFRDFSSNLKGRGLGCSPRFRVVVYGRPGESEGFVIENLVGFVQVLAEI